MVEGYPIPWPEEGRVEFPIPNWPRDCEHDAQVALWKWREQCDRKMVSHWKPKCPIRAPSPKRCCKRDGDKLYSEVVKSKSCFGGFAWPMMAREAAMCAVNCDMPRTLNCDVGSTLAKNNPKKICECQFRHCNVPRGLNETDAGGKKDLDECERSQN